MRILFSFVLLFIVNISQGQIGASKRALKHLERGHLDKSIRLVNKVLSKDSLFPAALYVRSRILWRTPHVNPDIDSAYAYILLAQKMYESLDTKERERHLRAGIDSMIMAAQKQRLDSAAFSRAAARNSESSFIYFIKHFNTASQVSKAIALRNALAYASAVAENTYRSYEEFLDKYPKAVQVKEAKKRYEKLYFERRTKDGKLKSYLKFLKTHPDTPYRDEIETHIYEVTTARHSANSYLSFIGDFPDSKMRDQAVAYLYHVLKEQDRRLPDKFLSDSLRRVGALEGKVVIPFWENGKYGFMDAGGEVIIRPTYTHIPEEELCGGTDRDYLLLKNEIIGLNQAQIFDGIYQGAEDLGYGLIKIIRNGKSGVIHKSGIKILPSNYEQVKLLAGKFIAFKQSGLWGLTTVSGREIVNAQFTSIVARGPFIIFEKNDIFDIKDEAALINSVDNNPLKFNMYIDDFEVISEGQLWIRSLDKETVLNSSLEEVIPLDTQEIKLMKSGFLIDNGKNIYFLDKTYRPINRKKALSAEVSDLWIALECEHEWLLYDTETYTLRYQGLDSLKLLGNYYAKAFKNDSVAVITRDRPLLLNLNEKVYLLTESGSEQYLLIVNGGDEKRLINKMGQEIFTGSFDEAKPLGSNYIVISNDGKKGLISASGEVLIPQEYDAIGNYEQGFISLLKDKKFGLFNQDQALFIPAAYDKNLLRYSNHIFVAEKNGKRGFINDENQACSSFDFDEILYWNDSVAFVKRNKGWLLYNVNSQTVMTDGIKSVSILVRNEDEMVAAVLKDSGYGLISNRHGEIISAIYNDIVNLGTREQPVYFAEKHISDAHFYIMIYYNKRGEVIRKQALDAQKYLSTHCNQ